MTLLFVAGCSVPWKNERRDAINIAFDLRNNQPIITAKVNHKPGAFVVGSAQPVSVVDPNFLQVHRGRRNSQVTVTLGERHSLRVAPAPVETRPIADGILGADAFRASTLTIDYRGRVIVLNDQSLPMDDMQTFRFRSLPRVPIHIDGQTYQALVDTSVPDTLLLPASFGAAGRRNVNATIAGVEFRGVDASVGESSEIRIGNRILANFLVMIDFRRGVVGLWRDPRP
ncbi:MAG TPA: hypothetical protein VIL97_01495 [Thermoanaerobaculia bacterium]